jgi:hypothetical protein|nr:MAG TPA: putative tail component [Caudoviricetes sp.]
MSIKADALASEIAKILTEYEAEIVKNADTCGKAVANAAAKELRRTSPKRKGEYAKSWGVTREAGGFGENARYIVHNKKRYRLTHLLEHGHVMANGKRTRAIPHIKPVEEQVIREYEKQVREAIEDAAK